MKNQLTRAFRGRWLALLLSALFLVGMLPPAPAAVAESGSLNVKLTKEIYDDLPKDPVVEVTLYQIGVADGTTNAGWRIDDAFAGYGILRAATSAELGVVAENIARDIVGKDQYEGTPKPLTGGSAIFPVSEMGVYFGMVTKAPEGLEVTPFIVTVPSRDPKTQELRTSYDVVLKESCVTSATVKKVWDDANDQDGKRPDFIEVTLSDGQKVTLNDANEWTATVDDLPIYKDGEKIAYTWVEAKVDGYTATQVTDGAITTLTNVHKPEEVEATVKKVWDDADDQDDKRPDFIEVTLSDGQKVTLNDANEWTATIAGLPRYADGQEIKYTWTEAKVDGYTSTQVTDGTITTLTNSYKPETTEATVKKVWQDSNNADGIRPKSIKVTLSNGQTVTLNDANEWTATITDLPKYDKGKEIKYTWTEAKVDGYTATQVTDGTITTLTNTHTPPPPPPPTTTTTQLSGQKIWKDNGDEMHVRPTSITVTLLADGVPQPNVKPTWTNTDTDEWTYTFNNLPAENDAGETINYTVKETPVEFYDTSIDGNTITNTLQDRSPKYGSLTITKTWKEVSAAELNEASEKQPDSVSARLYRDGEEIMTFEIKKENNWAYKTEELPLDDGYRHKYKYTVREDEVPGYFARVDGLNLINTKITPDIPGKPKVPGTPTRKTFTPPPPFRNFTEKEIDDLLDILDYGTPLWGTLLGTGDETPIYPYVFGGVGALALVALAVFGRKRKKKVK